MEKLTSEELEIVLECLVNEAEAVREGMKDDPDEAENQQAYHEQLQTIMGKMNA